MGRSRSPRTGLSSGPGSPRVCGTRSGTLGKWGNGGVLERPTGRDDVELGDPEVDRGFSESKGTDEGSGEDDLEDTPGVEGGRKPVDEDL